MGVPRVCIHRLLDVLDVLDVLDDAAWLAGQFRDRTRVVALVPAYHLYGIGWAALLPAALAIPLIVAWSASRSTCGQATWWSGCPNNGRASYDLPVDLRTTSWA
jgi:hypothetical protein